jgi:hypothetical protein
MKKLNSSDINPMVLETVNNTNIMNNAYTINLAARPLAMPVSTSEIWGFESSPVVDSAIWGTLGSGAVRRKQNFSAIWGTSANQAEPQGWAMHSSMETIQ